MWSACFVSVDKALVQYAFQIGFRVYFLNSCVICVDYVNVLDARVADFLLRHWWVTVVFVAEALDESDVAGCSLPRRFSKRRRKRQNIMRWYA